jgi:hypothetical protein
LSTYLANAISLPMLSLAYQNWMICMTYQHFLKKFLHLMNKSTHFELPHSNRLRCYFQSTTRR